MTQAEWHFREFRPGDNVSDPDFARALFSGDDSAEARSLVRESIQNSLDARRTPTTPVIVRFAIRTGPRAAASAAAKRFFAGLWPHILSGDSGLQDAPNTQHSIPYLVVEDFGTHGLRGDPAVWSPFEAERNAFFLFFRALGKSGKEGEDRGRWGVGKFVFPMSSRCHALLALTVPSHDPKSLVMGRSVLKTHRANSVSFHPDGHWGFRDESGLVLPTTDEDTARSLRAVFDIRRVAEPGLSVVVPWLRSEITGAAIRDAVAGEYFLPILRGELTVEVDENGSTTTIDAGWLTEMAHTLSPPLTRARVELGLEAATWPSADVVNLSGSQSSGDYGWESSRLTDPQRERSLSKLEAGGVVGFRVPTCARPKGVELLATHFDVFIQHVQGLGHTRPLIVREGITIAEDRTKALHDYVALLVIDDRALATFVGDAETPAHNALQYDLVKAKYTLAGKLIELLRYAPSRIIGELEGGDRSADRSLLAAFFPFADPTPAPRRPKTPAPSHEGDEIEEVPDIPTHAPRFRIGKVRTGFSVSGTGAIALGARIRIECGYDLRRGNPLRKYRQLDFALGRDVSYNVDGLVVEEAVGNRFVGVVTEPLFQSLFAGFDENRNVFVRVIVDESAGDQ
jgi:hypothetical protein